MIKLLISNKQLFLIYIPLIFISGMAGGYITASFTFIFGVHYLISERKYAYAICLFFFVFIMADNLAPNFRFFNNLRFVVLGYFLVLSFKNITKSNLSLYLLPFTIAAFVISLFYSPVWGDSLLRTFAFISSGIIIFGTFKTFYLKDPVEFSNTFLTFVFVIYLIPLIILLVPGLNSILFIAERYRGIMGNPNGLALLSIILYPFIEILLCDKKNIGIVKILIIISVVLTSSRNGISSIFIYEVLKYSLKRRFGIIYILAAILTGLTANLIDFTDFLNNLGLGSFLRLENIESGSGRVEVWQVIVEEIKRQPWTGFGLYYENSFLASYIEETLVSGRQWGSVWNSYLTMILNVGIIGSICYFYFIYKIYKAARIRILATAFLVAALYSAIFESWLMASLNAFTPLFFFYFAIQSIKASQLAKQ